VTASLKQVQLIERLQDLGAAIPSKDGGDPDLSMMDSVPAADAYIKQWMHLLSNGPCTTTRMEEWGNVPNC
jgi:hypothetical protein